MVRKQYVLMSNEELGELEHFGVRGMKWGVRKDRTKKPNFIERHRKRKEIAKTAKKIGSLIKYDEKGNRTNTKRYNDRIKKVETKLKRTQEYKDCERVKRLYNAMDKALWGKDDYEERIEPYEVMYSASRDALRKRTRSMFEPQRDDLKKDMLADLGLEANDKNMAALDNWRLRHYFEP